ncbi:MAG TPA: DUF3891 family protein [Tepidisphaeraceae bacterium]|nr:DUF3891 family protein [Tepidisphaeraceae bacterium]
MIRREVGSDFFLIAQNDHAILAGQLAQHFGNDRFARPEPRESVLTGVRMHDAGWPLHDDEPTLNADHRPLDVFETPRPIGLKVWAASAERAAAVDPYAGLLVSLHSLALSIFATSPSTPGRHERFDVSQLSERFEVNKFQHREVERQEQLRKQLGLPSDLPLTHGLAEPHASADDDRLAFHFRMLQAMDLFSLCVCCTKPPADKTQDVFPKPGATATHLKLRRDEKHNALRVDPWPFDQPRLELSVPYRRVPARAYQGPAELHRQLAAAAAEQLVVIVTE